MNNKDLQCFQRSNSFESLANLLAGLINLDVHFGHPFHLSVRLSMENAITSTVSLTRLIWNSLNFLHVKGRSNFWMMSRVLILYYIYNKSQVFWYDIFKQTLSESIINKWTVSITCYLFMISLNYYLSFFISSFLHINIFVKLWRLYASFLYVLYESNVV